MKTLETVVRLEVPGKPVPQGAIKTFLAGGKARGRHSNAAELQDYRARVAMAAREEMGDLPPTECPVFLRAWFFIPRPKGHFGSGKNSDVVKRSAPSYPITRPDLSHYVRALEDGLTGVVVKDDSQIVSTLSSKAYSDRPRTEVTVELLPRTVGALDG